MKKESLHILILQTSERHVSYKHHKYGKNGNRKFSSEVQTKYSTAWTVPLNSFRHSNITISKTSDFHLIFINISTPYVIFSISMKETNTHPILILEVTFHPLNQFHHCLVFFFWSTLKMSPYLHFEGHMLGHWILTKTTIHFIPPFILVYFPFILTCKYNSF